MFDGDTSAQLWRNAAGALRNHAAKFEARARTLETDPDHYANDLRVLLHHIHSHLGLAIHRGEGSLDRWKLEADQLRSRIDLLIDKLGLS